MASGTNEQKKLNRKHTLRKSVVDDQQCLHSISVEELCERLRTDVEKGLTDDTVKHNLEQYGSNKVSSRKVKSGCFRFLKHSLQGISSVMLAGSIVCYMAFLAELFWNVAEPPDLENLYIGTTLLLFMFVTGLYSYFKERKALSLLKDVLTMVSLDTTVIRNGEKIRLNSQEIVVGDIVDLRYGDTVPADIRVIRVAQLKIDDSTLSGAAEPKVIRTECTHSNPLVTKNMIFASTFVVEGICRGIVISVGQNTVAGRISKLTSHKKDKPTMLSREITTLVLTFTCIGLMFALAFWILAMTYNKKWADASIYFVATCIAVCPESLISAINVSHTVSGSRMMKKNCVAKRFDAIENLGTTSIVCVDKTGTLTQNQMFVSHLWNGAKTFDVLQDKVGKLTSDIDQLEPLFRCMVLTSRSVFKTTRSYSMSEPRPHDLEVEGRDPGDIAMLRCAGHNYHHALDLNHTHQRIHDVPYNYRKFYQLSIHQLAEDKALECLRCHLVVKGAPEIVFQLCSTILCEDKEVQITESATKEFKNALSELASLGERVVGMCDFKIDSPVRFPLDKISESYPKHGYRFLGLVSMADPAGITVKDSISKLRAAFVKVIMITGDHPATAITIAREVGIFSQGVETANKIAEKLGTRVTNLDKSQKVAIFLTGDVLDKMSKGTLDRIITDFQEIVFARVSPTHKMYIVESCQRTGAVVTMVGDGVNDVYAMKAADISISMGLRSSEAAKNISDIVLLDNNFSSVLAGIEEGRLIFDNMRKSAAFALTSNVSEVLPFLMLLILQIPLPLSPMGILLISVGADLFPSIALAYEKPESTELMKPRDITREKLFTGSLVARAYLRIGPIQFFAGIFAYLVVMAENGFRISELIGQSRLWYSHKVYQDSHNQDWTYDQRMELERAAQTAYFYAIVLCQLVNAVCCKNRQNSIFLHGMNNWRLNLTLCIQFVIASVVTVTQFHHFLEHSMRIKLISWYWLLPGLPFAIFIFIYDECRRFVFRKWPTSWISRVLYF